MSRASAISRAMSACRSGRAKQTRHPQVRARQDEPRRMTFAFAAVLRGRLRRRLRMTAMSAAALEILHGALVLLGGRARGEGAEVAAAAVFRILLAGIKPVFAAFE